MVTYRPTSVLEYKTEKINHMYLVGSLVHLILNEWLIMCDEFSMIVKEAVGHITFTWNAENYENLHLQ
jgi:hypothetical protein